MDYLNGFDITIGGENDPRKPNLDPAEVEAEIERLAGILGSTTSALREAGYKVHSIFEMDGRYFQWQDPEGNLVGEQAMLRFHRNNYNSVVNENLE